MSVLLFVISAIIAAGMLRKKKYVGLDSAVLVHPYLQEPYRIGDQ